MFLFFEHMCDLNLKTLVVTLYISCNYFDVNLFSPEINISSHVYRLSVSHVIVRVCHKHFASNGNNYIFMDLLENAKINAIQFYELYTESTFGGYRGILQITFYFITILGDQIK